MAKVVQVAKTSSSDWKDLPGNSGEFSNEGESIDDTIFGSTYQSMEAGLVSWSISANAIYKGFAGYEAKLLKSNASNALTNEALSSRGSNVYQITDSTKRILDRSAAVTVGATPVAQTTLTSAAGAASTGLILASTTGITATNNIWLWNGSGNPEQVRVSTVSSGTNLVVVRGQGGTTARSWSSGDSVYLSDPTVRNNIAATNIKEIDYLFGKVEFISGYSVPAGVTLAGKYFSTETLGKPNSYTLTMTTDPIDNTDFSSAQTGDGRRTYEPGLRTVSLSLDGTFSADVNAKEILTDRDEIIVEIDPAGDGKSICRGFFRVISTSQSGDVGALEEESIELTLNVPAEEKLAQAFGWEHASDTLLTEAVRIVLEAWLTESETLQAQYLPSGTTGQSPLDGAKGNVIVTDVSLTGGLDDMNTFACEMQGTGRWTEV